jgi:hypothetical protein
MLLVNASKLMGNSHSSVEHTAHAECNHLSPLTFEEFASLRDRSEKDNVVLSYVEKMRMIAYIDQINEENKKLLGHQTGLISLISWGPICWNGWSGHSYPGGRKCWSCDRYHIEPY